MLLLMCATTNNASGSECEREPCIQSINACNEHVRCFVYHKCKELWSPSSSLTEIKHKINEQFNNGTSFYVKTDKLGSFIGFVGLGYISMMHQICNLYVDSKYRNHGHGTSLVRFIMNKQSGSQIKQVYVWCEPNLQYFYEKNGFTIVKFKLLSVVKNAFINSY